VEFTLLLASSWIDSTLYFFPHESLRKLIFSCVEFLKHLFDDLRLIGDNIFSYLFDLKS